MVTTCWDAPLLEGAPWDSAWPWVAAAQAVALLLTLLLVLLLAMLLVRWQQGCLHVGRGRHKQEGGRKEGLQQQ